jgi:hypothetical protein
MEKPFVELWLRQFSVRLKLQYCLQIARRDLDAEVLLSQNDTHGCLFPFSPSSTYVLLNLYT